jgi:hypothetical protein
MESFKEYLTEWNPFKRKVAPAPAPEPEKKMEAPKTNFTGGGFTSRNPKDHVRTYARDFLKSEYAKHNNISEKDHTDETRKRRDELEAEVMRRGMPKRMRPEEHEAMKNRPKPSANIHWTDEKGQKRHGY